MRPTFEIIDANKLTGFDRINWLALQISNGIQYHNGITIGLDFHRPNSGYAISIFKSIERTYPKIDQFQIIEFIQDNLDLLSCNCNYIGAWVNDGLIYLDISVILSDKDRAI